MEGNADSRVPDTWEVLYVGPALLGEYEPTKKRSDRSMEAGAPSKCFRPRNAAAAAAAAVRYSRTSRTAVCTSCCTARTHGLMEPSKQCSWTSRVSYRHPHNVALLTHGRAQGNPRPTDRADILHGACTAVGTGANEVSRSLQS